MEEGVHEQQADPFGYGGCYTTPPASPPHGASAGLAADRESTPPPRSPAGEEDEGTPKVPLVAWGGRPGRVCPGAPRKGKAPDDFFTGGGAAHQDAPPVRRLSFGDAASAAPDADMASDSMEEDDVGCVHQQQHQAAAPAAAHHLHISPHAAPYQPLPDDQVLLSPSPPPMQQLWAQQHQALQPLAPHGEQVPMQQQLFGGAPPSRQLRPQQLWPASQQQQQQQQQTQPPVQQRALWPGPLSPTGAPRPPQAQGSSTPARLFR